MKNKIILAFMLMSTAYVASAQRKQIDSLKLFISKAAEDSTKVKALFDLAQNYKVFNADSAIINAQRSYALSVITKTTLYQMRSLNLLANTYTNIGNYSKAMALYYNVLRQAQDQNDNYEVILINNNIGNSYNLMADYVKGLQYLRMAKTEYNAYLSSHKNVSAKFNSINIFIHDNLGEAFIYTNKLDSAAIYLKEGMKCQEKFRIYILKAALLRDWGLLEAKRGNAAAALKYFHEAVKVQLADNDLSNLSISYSNFADLYNKMNKPDSAIYYAERALAAATEGKILPGVVASAKLLYGLYDQQHNLSLAYKYYKIATQANDSLNSKDKLRELASLDFDEKQRQLNIIATKAAFENKVRSYILVLGLAVVVLVALFFWRTGQQRKKANSLLNEQKEEIEATLHQLKSTQTQLIQSEKMPSLGELTAGIAHEIQNPLNFVNNFSEVNTELIDEMQAEIDKGDYEEAKAIANDIKENQIKISQHGKRADFIVKGMLQHSRTSTGERQPTNINVLADEFLKLSYHGMRAKDKNFNADLVTNFDKTLPPINIVQQDIGRVLLNLFNNAFYAVSQKQKTTDMEFKPEITVSTAAGNGNVIIRVKDNGSGIPDAIKDKIMQPFFTTKPTGEGTGLGLSLSYDILVKGHGGSIKVDSKQDEGSEFMISIPINN